MRALLKRSYARQKCGYTSYLVVTYLEEGALATFNTDRVITLTDDLNSFEAIRDWIHTRTGGVNRVHEAKESYLNCAGGQELPAGVTAILAIIVYEQDTVTGDMEESLGIAECNPGIRFNVHHELQQALRRAATDAAPCASIYLIRGAWIFNSYGSPYLTYDPKKARTITKRQVRAALNKKNEVKRNRKLNKLASSHFKDSYRGMWDAITGSKLFSKHLLNNMCWIPANDFGVYKYDVERIDLMPKVLGLERVVKQLFGKLIVTEDLHKLCVRLHEQFFSHTPKADLPKHEDALRKFGKRVIKAGITKEGSW